jgi:hypothetical protein
MALTRFTGTIDADFDTSGTYTVSITSADTAYGLLLNDSQRCLR